MAEVLVKINGKDIRVDADSTVLQAAQKAGHDIPTLCHQETLSHFTSCFICAVKVEGGRDTLVPSCATKVREGMSVIVDSQELLATRKMGIDLLLSDHYGDCLPPCEDECPASIDIRGFLKLVSQGKESEAAALIRKTAPFPGILGRVCPRPCEAVCRRARVEEPISICYMKRHIADSELKEKGRPILPQPAASTGKKVAIIGAGPAGMSAAYYLRLQGHAVTVFEAHKDSGGMLRYGIPFYRLPDEVIRTEMGAVEELGVKVKYNCRIGRDIMAKELEKEFDSLIIAMGAQGASSMRIQGEEQAGVFSGIDYLEALALGNPPELGNRVLVVGGGNTAVDVARSSLRKGARVTVLYRRSKQEMPASDFEIEEMLHEGVELRFLAAPVSLARDGELLQLQCVRMELGEPDESGRRRPLPVAGSEFTLEATAVIGAIGQQVLPEAVADLGVEVTRWGTVVTDGVTFQTSRPGIFAVGDCQTGADIAVRAVGNGRKTAVAVDQYLKGEQVAGEPELFNSSMGPLETVSEALFTGYDKVDRIAMPVIPDQQRLTSSDEIESGFLTPEARREAERCLKCGCDAADDCKLRDYATRFNGDQVLFQGEIREYRSDESHKDIKMEIHKCISCGACVRACSEIKGLDVFSIVNRGFVTRMTAPFGRSLVDTVCDGCGECVKVCPTAGVMNKKDSFVNKTL